MCIAHRREIETYIQGEGELVWGIIFVLLIHLYSGSFVGFCSLIGFSRINLRLSCDCVSFSDPVYAIVVKLN